MSLRKLTLYRDDSTTPRLRSFTRTLSTTSGWRRIPYFRWPSLAT